MKTIYRSLPPILNNAPAPKVRLLGSGAPLVARAANLWRTAPVWRPDSARLNEVWVALDGSSRTLSELAPLNTVSGAHLLIANLDDPALALAAPQSTVPIWWISMAPPQARLGALGEEVHGAWREEGDVLRFVGPDQERTFLLPEGFPEAVLIQALAGLCVGHAFQLPAHTLQRWLQYLASSQVATAANGSVPSSPSVA